MMLVADLEQRLTFDLRRAFFHRALRMDQAAFGDERTSGLLSRFHADIGFVTAGQKALFGSAMREPLKMLACLLGASLISWRLLVFSLLLTPLTAFLIRRLALSIKRANRRSLEEFSHLFGVLTEAFNGIETVQAFTLEPFQRSKFYRASKECFRKGMKIAFYNALTKPVTEVFGIGVICLALLSGAYLTLNHQTHIFGVRMTDRPIDIELLLVFYALLIGATEPARKLSDVFNSLQAGVAASERLFPLLDRAPGIVSPESPVAVPSPFRKIVFDDVNFHYTPGRPVLLDLSLQIGAGETVAIVGPNGCGKTTLLNLLPRFCDPTTGRVRLDDTDIRQVHLKDLRSRIGLVTQRSLLFDDTVYNNIRHGRMDASQADIVRAAKQAKADRFIIEKLRDGYDTVIGTGGSNLSGGQRQRLALARAFLRDPEILILDEATNQIDLESEQLIHQALEQFAKNRTVIIVTHRLSTLALADRIVVMDHGRIEDVGSHEQLLARCEVYRRLHEIQFQRSA
jgi:ATP-binding cassette subfamily B protein/subfamily B ATP-binding cassette protein MsbA